MAESQKIDHIMKNVDHLINDTEKLVAQLASFRLNTEKQISMQQAIIDSIPNPVFFMNKEELFLGCNNFFETVFEISKHEIKSKTFKEVVPSHFIDAEQIEQQILSGNDYLFENEGLLADEITLKRDDGFSYYFIFYKASFTDDNGAIQGIVGILVDITEFKQIENQLRQNQEQLRLVTEIAPFALIMCRNFDHSMIYANQQAKNLFMLPDNLESFESINDVKIFYKNSGDMDKIVSEVQSSGLIRDIELKMKRYNHEEFWGLVSATPIVFMGESALLIAINDISQRKLLEQQLIELATTDSLTGINNRRHFFQLGEQEFFRSKRLNYDCSVLMLDIDFFKKINDTYGHDVGDIAIKFMANTCKALIRDIDIVGRLGGEEFAVILPETHLNQAMVVAERIRHTIEHSKIYVNNDLSIQFTVSIGISGLNLKDNNPTIETTLGQADQALYSSKHNGRNQVTIYQA